jgi:hypothetical protein
MGAKLEYRHSNGPWHELDSIESYDGTLTLIQHWSTKGVIFRLKPAE